MDHIVQALLDVPPISRIWMISIVASTMATTLNIVSPLRLMFVPSLIATQPWRLFTSFCYFGELSVPVVLAIVTTLRWSLTLEGNFYIPLSLFPNAVHRFDQRQTRFLDNTKKMLQSMDFLYFLIIVSLSIIIASSLGGYWFDYKMPFLGLILHEIITYISCRLNPNQMVNILGILDVQGNYIPILTSFLELLLHPEFRGHLTLLVDEGIQHLPNLLWCPPVYRTYVCLLLGHLWWFYSFYYFNAFYYDKNYQREMLKFKRRENEPLLMLHLSKLGLKMLLLPPWYWVIISNIERNTGAIRNFQG